MGPFLIQFFFFFLIISLQTLDESAPVTGKAAEKAKVHWILSRKTWVQVLTFPTVSFCELRQIFPLLQDEDATS